MSNFKSKHAFGAEANIDTALAQGLIDAYDILFLNEGKIGWIDKDGNKVIVEDKKQVVTVTELPETGDAETVYICGNKFYFWNGTEFTTPETQGVDESAVDAKIDAAKAEITESANAYTDEQIAEAIAIVEF